jgi:hypothetical protein
MPCILHGRDHATHSDFAQTKSVDQKTPKTEDVSTRNPRGLTIYLFVFSLFTSIYTESYNKCTLSWVTYLEVAVEETKTARLDLTT